MNTDAITRLVVERDLHASRVLDLQARGCVVFFTFDTITAEEKRELRKHYDAQFPIPPIITVQTPLGSLAKFDLQDKDYQVQLEKWSETLAYGVLAATLRLTTEEVYELEQGLPALFMQELFSTAELINGIEEPIADLIRDAIWAPEVLAWLETYKPKGDDVKVSDTGLYRQLDAMFEAGLDFKRWDEMTPRQRLLTLNWYDYKRMREAYINWWSFSRTDNTAPKGGNPMRIALGG